jgi:hypothetical protein
VTSASSTFDPTDSDWDTSVPSKGTGDVFLSGVALPVPTFQDATDTCAGLKTNGIDCLAIGG